LAQSWLANFHWLERYRLCCLNDFCEAPAVLEVEDKINLAPGMARSVTVEIRTGTRRLIEYPMSPLLRYRQESLRDR
jgi:hypothetical protein